MTDISPETEPTDLIAQAKGRAAFLRDRGEVKTPDMLEALAARLAEAEADLSSGSFYKEADADWIIKRAEAAEAERDALRAEMERLKTAPADWRTRGMKTEDGYNG